MQDVLATIGTGRGGPDSDWNREILHAKCNMNKKNEITVRARTLAAEHGVVIVPASSEKFLKALRRSAADLALSAHRGIDIKFGHMTLTLTEFEEIWNLIHQIEDSLSVVTGDMCAYTLRGVPQDSDHPDTA